MSLGRVAVRLESWTGTQSRSCVGIKSPTKTRRSRREVPGSGEAEESDRISDNGVHT